MLIVRSLFLFILLKRRLCEVVTCTDAENDRRFKSLIEKKNQKKVFKQKKIKTKIIRYLKHEAKFMHEKYRSM